MVAFGCAVAVAQIPALIRIGGEYVEIEVNDATLNWPADLKKGAQIRGGEQNNENEGDHRGDGGGIQIEMAHDEF